jgi:copper chaperone CopZ
MTTLFVPKIKCDGCADTVRKAVEPLVDKVDVDIEAKQVHVTLLPAVEESAVRKALEEAGYPAQ